MRKWSEEAIVISTRKFGENDLIATALGRESGLYSGMVRGGQGKRQGPVWQPGNLVLTTWKARLPDQLGSFTAELISAPPAHAIPEKPKLYSMLAALSLILRNLPEREPHPEIFSALAFLLASYKGPDWLSAHARFEVELLKRLGFGLDLSRCAATGKTAQLTFVSPRTGRAVSLEAGEKYRDRLFALPPFLLAETAAHSQTEAAEALKLSGYFLAKYLYNPVNSRLPEAREVFFSLVSQFTKAA